MDHHLYTKLQRQSEAKLYQERFPQSARTSYKPLPLTPGLGIVRCKHLGDDTGRVVDCPSCNGALSLKLFDCKIFRDCTVYKPAPGHGCCRGCPAYSPLEAPNSSQEGQQPLQPENLSPEPPAPVLEAVRKPMPPLKWEYGITTVPDRRDTYFKQTVSSLAQGGFNNPRLFIDGADTSTVIEYQRRYRLEVTPRYPQMGCHHNWILSLYELYLRNPNADRYAIFQDDLVCMKNLRQYLEQIPYPSISGRAGAYLNLYTFRENHNLIQGKPIGFLEGSPLETSANGGKYFGKQQQAGRSALALVFNRDAVQVLLQARQMVMRILDAGRGGKGLLVDGGIVEAMNQANFWEFIHNPSLVQHSGDVSTIGHHNQSRAKSFLGENQDALSLLPFHLSSPILP